ncbi:MAG: purine-nucleoside phosphorylase [Candidatus Izemoplasmatales bacterium]|nr:purine-nucleoside phosphorylase [Candidatus Izemoplasmatales bacterium]NLF48080.1 purine-nucleoside phosphorylase [Acholeplasmataceae bacterium]
MPIKMNNIPIDYYDEARSVIFGHTDIRPEILVILGSGFSRLVDLIKKSTRISTHVIPHFPCGNVQGHPGNLYVGSLGKTSVYCLQGRPHYYEGWNDADMRFAIQLFAHLGVKRLIVTNACGSMNPEILPKDMMLIKDHINMMGRNPLVGEEDNDFGSRFVDMTDPYDPEFLELAETVAKKMKINYHKGVYVGYLGPSYETKSEIQCFRQMGGDAIGMSTVPEVIVANRCQMKVLGIASITNWATGLASEPLSHERVLERSNQIDIVLSEWIRQIILQLAKETRH